MSEKNFIQTWPREGGTFVHIAGQADYTLCGLDAAGDDTIHARNPKYLEGERVVTCPDCRHVVKIVKRYLGKNKNPTAE